MDNKIDNKIGVEGYYKLLFWPESQKFMDKEEYPEVEYLITDDMQESGAVFVPFKYLNKIATQRVYGDKVDKDNPLYLKKEGEE